MTLRVHPTKLKRFFHFVQLKLIYDFNYIIEILGQFSYLHEKLTLKLLSDFFAALILKIMNGFIFF